MPWLFRIWKNEKVHNKTRLLQTYTVFYGLGLYSCSGSWNWGLKTRRALLGTWALIGSNTVSILKQIQTQHGEQWPYWIWCVLLLCRLCVFNILNRKGENGVNWLTLIIPWWVPRSFWDLFVQLSIPNWTNWFTQDSY